MKLLLTKCPKGYRSAYGHILKKQKNCKVEDLEMGDCWIGISLALESGLIIGARVGKHSDRLLSELAWNTEGKTDCKNWSTDSWGGYERVLGAEIEHYMGKDRTQRLERTNGIVRQQTGRWRHEVSPLGHRRQNKFGKVSKQTEITTRLVVSYFNWIWSNIRWGTTTAMRAGLTSKQWSWNDLISYPTFF